MESITAVELRRIRKKLGMTGREFAWALGYSPGMVSFWENGKSPIPPSLSEKIFAIEKERPLASQNPPESAKSVPAPEPPAQEKQEKKSVLPKKRKEKAAFSEEMSPKLLRYIDELVERRVTMALSRVLLRPSVQESARIGDDYRRRTQEFLREGR